MSNIQWKPVIGSIVDAPTAITNFSMKILMYRAMSLLNWICSDIDVCHLSPTHLITEFQKFLVNNMWYWCNVLYCWIFMHINFLSYIYIYTYNVSHYLQIHDGHSTTVSILSTNPSVISKDFTGVIQKGIYSLHSILFQSCTNSTFESETKFSVVPAKRQQTLLVFCWKHLLQLQ